LVTGLVNEVPTPPGNGLGDGPVAEPTKEPSNGFTIVPSKGLTIELSKEFTEEVKGFSRFETWLDKEEVKLVNGLTKGLLKRDGGVASTIRSSRNSRFKDVNAGFRQIVRAWRDWSQVVSDIGCNLFGGIT